MRVQSAPHSRFTSRAMLASSVACALLLSGCASWRSSSDATVGDAAANAERSAAIANAGAQTVQATKLQRFLWIFSPYRPDIQQGNFVSQEMLDQVKVGQTREQVRFLLGSPLLSDVFHADRWDYPFYLARGNGELTTSRVSVFFEGDELVRIDGGNLPTEREYIERIAGPIKGSKKTQLQGRAVEPVKPGTPEPIQP